MPNDSTAVSAPANPSTEGAGNLSSEGVYAEILRRSQTPVEPEPEVKPEATAADETSDDVPEVTEEAEATDEPEAEAAEEAAESEDKEQQTDEEEAPEEDVPSKLPEKVQKALDKRIGKEVAKRKAAEEKAAEAERIKAELEQKLRAAMQQQAEPPVVTASADDPLADINTPDALEQRRSKAKDVIRTVEDVLDDAQEDEDGNIDVGGQKYTRQQLKQIARNARRDLEDHIPQREKFINARAQATVRAAEDFPWIKDPTSEKYQAAVTEYRRRPYLARDPESLYNVALAIEGRFYVEERKKAAQKPETKKATPTPPKVDVTPKVVPAKKPTAQVKDQKAAQRRAEVTRENMTSDSVYSLLLQKELSKAGES